MHLTIQSGAKIIQTIVELNLYDGAWKKSTRIPGKIGMKTKFRTRVSFCDISYNEHGSIEKMKEQE
jgi:hypothetical protein